MPNDETEIRQLVETWMSATQAGDVETILDLMTDDVVFLRPGCPPMIGRETFAAASSGQSHESMKIDATSDIQEIQIFGDVAYMWTKLAVAVTLPDADRPIKRAGETLSVLRKQEGKWRLARDANLLTVAPEQGE